MFLPSASRWRIKHRALASTTWTLPLGAGDTAYEADAAYYIQSYGDTRRNQPPDLAIEVVVSHPATKALRAGAMLKIPEFWVLDLPKHKLRFSSPRDAREAQRDLSAPDRSVWLSRGFTRPMSWNGSMTRRPTIPPTTRTAANGLEKSSSGVELDADEG